MLKTANATMPKDELRRSQMDAALNHAFRVGVGWLTLTYLARTLSNKIEDESNRKESDKEIKSYIKARYPTVHNQPLAIKALPKAAELPAEDGEGTVEGDTAVKKKAGLFGDTLKFPSLTMPKVANDDTTNQSGDIKRDFAQAGESIWRNISQPGIHRLHMVLTAAAVLTGGAAGYKLADFVHKTKTKRKLNAEIDDIRQEMDQVFMDEYARTRGLTKTASNRSFWRRMLDPTAEADPTPTTGSDGVSVRTKNSLGNGYGVFNTIARSYLLYAAGLAALSYSVSKSAFDREDPRRIERKALETYARDRAKAHAAPVLISPGYRPRKPKAEASDTTEVPDHV